MNDVEHILLDVGTLIFGFGAVLDLSFLVWYMRVARWRSSGIGVMFVLMSAANLAAGLAILLGRVLGPHFPHSNYPGRAEITLTVFVVFAAAMTLKLLVFAAERAQPDEPTPRLGFPSKKKRKRISPRLQAVERVVTGPNAIVRKDAES